MCLAELERARGDKRLIDQFDVVLNDLLRPLAKKNKDYWPAEFEAGRLALEKYDYGKRPLRWTRRWPSIPVPPRFWSARAWPPLAITISTTPSILPSKRCGSTRN